MWRNREQDSMHVESARRLQFVSDKPLNIEGGTHGHYITVGASPPQVERSQEIGEEGG
jgi:hypothetical protein